MFTIQTEFISILDLLYYKSYIAVVISKIYDKKGKFLSKAGIGLKGSDFAQ